MEYLKLVKSETINVAQDTVLNLDTHGLMARLRVTDGELYITGEEGTVDSSCAVIPAGSEISFVGVAKLLAKDAAAQVFVLYFDRV